MSAFLALLVSGLVAGGLYALLATGLVLTYDTSGIFDFAHGAVAYVCALTFFLLRAPEGAGWSSVAAAAVSVLVVAPALGLLLDRTMFRALARAPEIARIIATVGLLVALPALTRVVLDAVRASGAAVPDTTSVVAVPALGPVPATVWNPLAGVAVNSDQMLVLAVAGVAAIGLWALLRRTRFGLRTRATVDDRELAQLRSVDVESVSTITWILGFVLAGLTGVLVTPLYQLDPGIFTLLTVASFTAVVFARFRSLPLAFAGGVALGVVQNLVYGYAPPALKQITGLRDAIPFMLLFVVVLWRGSSRVRPAGATVREMPPRAAPTRGWLAPVVPWMIAAVALVVALLVLSNFWASLLAKGLALGLVFVSFVVVTGLGGMVSLAQASFVTVSGLTVGMLTTQQFDRTMPVLMNNGRFVFLVAVAIAVGVAALMGAVVALASVRVGGLAFAIATLAFALTVETLLFRSEWLANGSQGWVVAAPSFGPMDLAQSWQLAITCFALAAGGALVVARVRGSRLGRALLAARTSDVAAAACGVSPLRARVTAFAISAAIAAVGGAMLAVTVTPFTGSSFSALAGVVWLAVVVTFGVRRPLAAVFAGVTVTMFPQALVEVAQSSMLVAAPAWLRGVVASPYLADVLFGLGAIGYARAPEGFVAQLVAWRPRRRSMPAALRTAADVPRAEPGGTALCVHGAQLFGGGASREFDLTVPDRGAVALVGPNGAGKTRAVRCISGLDPAPGGRIWLGGREVTDLGPVQRAQLGCRAIPERRSVFPNLSVEDNLALGIPDAHDRARIYAQYPQLAARRAVAAGSLSGGEQRLLGVAAAVTDPATLVVADEPTLGLAPPAAQRVMGVLANHHRRGGALVVVSERVADLVDMVEELVVVRNGAVVEVIPAAAPALERLQDLYVPPAAT